MPATPGEPGEPATTTPAEATSPAEAATPAQATTATPVTPATTATSASKRRIPPALRLPALLGLATVVLGGFGAWATVQAHNLQAAAAQQNLALADGPATAAVRHQVASAIQEIFSYRYTDTAATRRAAQHLLTGPAVRQYDRLFSLVAAEAPAEKLIVTTTVTDIGVELLTGSRARVLVFANQQDTRAGTHQSSYAGAMFAVNAVREGGRWKIENIDTFG
jgi:Mce-associated membrane protein